MAVAAAHGFGGVADPFVDHALVNSPTRTVGNETVTKRVPAFDNFPL